jgi:hypothetical protein
VLFTGVCWIQFRNRPENSFPCLGFFFSILNGYDGLTMFVFQRLLADKLSTFEVGSILESLRERAKAEEFKASCKLNRYFLGSQVSAIS